MSDQLRLGPVTEEDIEHLERMFTDPEAIGEFLWHGWRDERIWRQRWEDNRLLGDDRQTLMITVDERRAGFVWSRRIAAGSPFECWEIGISLWPEFRGHGYGTQAQRQAVRYLFTHTRLNRIQAMTDTQNIAEQRSLEKAGFTREGVLRGCLYRAGAWRDEVVYSVLRAEVQLD